MHQKHVNYNYYHFHFYMGRPKFIKYSNSSISRWWYNDSKHFHLIWRATLLIILLLLDWKLFLQIFVSLLCYTSTEMEFFPNFCLSYQFFFCCCCFLYSFPDKLLYIKLYFPVPWRSQIQEQIDWSHSQPGVREQEALTYFTCVSSSDSGTNYFTPCY